MNFKYSIFIFAVLYSLEVSGQEYENNWDSLDSRPLPGWYDEAKIGIFIHWGVFSVPSFGSEWFWQSWEGYHSPEYIKFMRDNYKPGFSYQEFAPMFTAEFFDPDEWAELFEASGARYVVLTSKHHEGFTLWPSKFSWSWNAMDVGPKRDLVGDLATSIRSLNSTMKFGLYHSLYEWFNPLYIEDKNANFTTDNFVQTKTMPELYEIVNQYLPDIIWSDGEWEAPDTYWQSTTFLAWLFNESPVKDEVLVNDRWGGNTLCNHGSYYTCSDRFNPGVVQDHKWENCMTLDLESWGYRRNAKYDDYITIEKLLQTIVETVTCGGNILVNVGPTAEGTIPSIMEERLRQMGQWLDINGEAIYKSQPWIVQQDELTPGVWYSTNDDILYAFVYEWPSQAKTVTLASVSSNATVSILGDTIQRTLDTTPTPGGLVVTFPPREEVEADWLWTLKIEA